MDWTLEVIVVPVSDLDLAKDFYANRLGFHVDHDTSASGDIRVIQLTPPGSGCSIVIGRGIAEMTPGSLQGLQLVVPDVRKARHHLVDRGVDVSEVQVYGTNGLRTATDTDLLDNAGFVFFADPDGNGWAIQQMANRR